jgi:protein N-terminal methyltransferase
LIQGTLQSLDPAKPLAGGRLKGTVGRTPDVDEMESGFDAAWCQWCLGHLSDPDLTAFFIRLKGSLRSRDTANGESASLIIVKENVCFDGPMGEPRHSFDDEDSSITRYVDIHQLSDPHPRGVQVG